jgi:demethylmenaquinone methyltransferase / 2-methoxy-6-polyprenyl-1,4-benzoquinol methylase
MPNRFYNEGDRRAAAVNDLFASVARRYDIMNDAQSLGLHRVWKRKVVELSGARPGGQALDLCCGTGDIALALARRGVSVVGLDFSEPMLAVARNRGKGKPQRTEGAGQKAQIDDTALAGDGSNPRFIRGDAQQIPFPDNTFDIVTIGYGLRNLASIDAGLREMLRVTRPGGRLLILDFGKPDHALWRGIYFGYLRWIVPVLGRIICGDSEAYAYIFESLRHYPAQQEIAAKMRGAGLGRVRVFNLLGGIMSIHCAEKAPANTNG